MTNEWHDDSWLASLVRQILMSDAANRLPGFDFLASCGSCGTDSERDSFIVLLVCWNGELHHCTNVCVVSLRCHTMESCSLTILAPYFFSTTTFSADDNVKRCCNEGTCKIRTIIIITTKHFMLFVLLISLRDDMSTWDFYGGLEQLLLNALSNTSNECYIWKSFSWSLCRCQKILLFWGFRASC